MRIRTNVHTLHKAGNEAEEYEDAYDFTPPGDSGGTGEGVGGAARLYRFAVADGATEASFSALWATKLVRAYCQGELGAGVQQLAESLKSLQQEWAAEVGTEALAQHWYVEEKLKHGAFSALVGLTLQGAAGEAKERGGVAVGRWHALAVGDSCLFQVRGAELLVRFPLARAEEFNNRPFLLSSNPAGNEALIENTDTFIGDWQAGDRFYLMTDALAQWFLQAFERGERPWQTLARLDDGAGDRAFAEFISAERASQALKNDDVTALIITTEI